MLKNGITESFLISIVNFILLWKLFNVVNMRLLSPFLQNKWLRIVYVSFPHLSFVF